MVSLITLSAVVSLAAAAADPYNNNLGQVIFSHVLFRHGSRMPLEFYPNDPYKEASNWPFGVAQLTDVGKLQEYELGTWLRQRYNSLLSHRYDPEEIYVQSTDVDRTLMSAQCCMAGLYRPLSGERWDPAVAWQPIPVHTIPVQADYLLGASSTFPCPAYDEEMNRVRSLPEVRALEGKFQVMYDYVSRHTGNLVQDFSTAVKIYDELAIEEQYKMSIPEWAQAIYPEPIKEAGLYSFVLPTWTTLLQRLKVGPLLKEMVEHFQAKRASTLSPDRRLWVYSAHDATVSALLNTFKVFDIHFPPYGACVMLELRLIEEDYFVTLFYRNSTTSEPQLLPIKTCSTVCPLDQFVSLMQPLLPSDWLQECQLPPTTADSYVWLITIIVLGVLSCAVLVAVLIYCWWKRSSRIYLTMPSPYDSSIYKISSGLERRSTYPLPK